MLSKFVPYNLFFGLFAFILCLGVGPSALAYDSSSSGTESLPSHDNPNPTSLNIRLSHRPISPPEHLIKGSVELPNVQAASMLVAPSPQAAILEDDQHQRVLILSPGKNGQIRAQLLADLDLTPRIPLIAACAEDRGCAHDRRPITGGLGCIAICVQQALNPSLIP